MTENIKKLKFFRFLPELILKGEKDTTWRIRDDKNIQVDNILYLCDSSGKEFAKAKVTKIKETTFENLTKEDKEGHEEYFSDSEMYQAFSRYYKIKVGPKTKIKVIKFRLIK